MSKSNNADQIEAPVFAEAVANHLGEEARKMMTAHAILTAIFGKLETVMGTQGAQAITGAALSYTEEAAQALTLTEIDFRRVANRMDSTVATPVFN